MQTMIREAPVGVFLAMVGVPLAMAAVAVIAGLHARRQAQLVRQTRAVAIGMAEDGYRQFEGTVEAIDGQTVRAPLTGAECVWFEATVEEFRRTSHQARSGRADWHTVRHVTSSAPLLVRDRTGVCVVRVFGAEVTPTDKSRWTGGSLEPEDRNPPRVGPAQSTDGMVTVAGGLDSRFRYSERRIYAGDPLLVLGAYRSHTFDAPSLDGDEDDDTVADVVAVDADDEHADVWRRADAERFATLTALARRITKAEIEQGGRGQPLIIAATSSATHAYMNEMGSQAAMMVALVPLGLAALVVLARFS